MKKLYLIASLLLFAVQVYAQEQSIANTKLIFELPNKHWFKHSDQDANGKHIDFYKREAIIDSNGRQIIPNISIITEEVGDSADVILFSAQKRVSVPFEVDEVFSHDSEKAILHYGYAVGYRGSYTDQNALLHSVYVLHLINGTTGVQIIMDITADLFDEFGEEFRTCISSIKAKK